MSIISTLKSFYTSNTLKVWVCVAFLALLSFGVIEHSKLNSLKIELAISKQNILAAQDSLRVTKDKLGKDEFDKLAYVGTIKDLQKLNTDLASTAKAVKGNVDVIAETKASLKVDSVPLVVKTEPVISNNDTTIKFDFSFDSTYSKGNYITIAGIIYYNPKTGLSTGLLTKTEFNFNIITGIKGLKEGKPEIFVKSDNPNFIVSDIQGAILNPDLFLKPKPSKISFGLQLGFSPLSYNLSTKTINTQSQITFGAGIDYRLF